MPGFLVMEQNIVVIMLHDWHAGNLLGLHSNPFPLITRYNITQEIF